MGGLLASADSMEWRDRSGGLPYRNTAVLHNDGAQKTMGETGSARRNRNKARWLKSTFRAAVFSKKYETYSLRRSRQGKLIAASDFDRLSTPSEFNLALWRCAIGS